MNLGENIYSYRVQKNLSQGDLANALEVSRQSVSKWENNSAQPELDKLVRMSRVFGVSLDELVFGPAKEEKDMNDNHNGGMSLRHGVPVRIIAGAVLMLFGMVFFLLSIFWGDHLRFGEVVGELASITMVLLSLSMLATYHQGVLAVCGVVYMLYAILCYGILNVTSLSHYLFMSVAGFVLLIWFIVWGLASEKKTKQA